VVDATSATGWVGLNEPLAEALAAFRRFNYERIYLRPASVRQGAQVVDLLRALVEHYAAHPEHLPASRVLACERPADAEAFRASVTYVAGMTDRFACERAVELLAWPASALPVGFDVRR
jgi:dGTPase